MTPAQERAERAATIRTLTLAGHSANDIAARLDITDRTVVRYRKRLGLSKPAAPPITRRQLDRALPLLQDGAGYAEAARTVGCGRDKLQNHLPGYGLTKSEAGARSYITRTINRIGAAA